ncbi:hypothetical protein BDZ94DRAFT_729933 [Collybia nuda]|uniref:Uncharacterized protein n=1 Tax=Collybia nuda TaxID=64659 RepID=A0A9P5Y2W7_9AGAR|nr:hypothetical protein BDZ94DRAFT_729933 [Collybia nuda]
MNPENTIQITISTLQCLGFLKFNRVTQPLRVPVLPHLVEHGATCSDSHMVCQGNEIRHGFEVSRRRSNNVYALFYYYYMPTIFVIFIYFVSLLSSG